MTLVIVVIMLTYILFLPKGQGEVNEGLVDVT